MTAHTVYSNHLQKPQRSAWADCMLVLQAGTGEETLLNSDGVPELNCAQTFHPAHRQFWENEVFKTSE